MCPQVDVVFDNTCLVNTSQTLKWKWQNSRKLVTSRLKWGVHHRQNRKVELGPYRDLIRRKHFIGVNRLLVTRVDQYMYFSGYWLVIVRVIWKSNSHCFLCRRLGHCHIVSVCVCCTMAAEGWCYTGKSRRRKLCFVEVLCCHFIVRCLLSFLLFFLVLDWVVTTTPKCWLHLEEAFISFQPVMKCKLVSPCALSWILCALYLQLH